MKSVRAALELSILVVPVLFTDMSAFLQKTLDVGKSKQAGTDRANLARGGKTLINSEVQL